MSKEVNIKFNCQDIKYPKMTEHQIQNILTGNDGIIMPRQHLAIIPNCYWGLDLNHEADLLTISKTRIATEYEIKVNYSDFKKDKAKHHGHRSDKINKLYYVAPGNLADRIKNELPENAGLVSIDLLPDGAGKQYFRARKVLNAKKRPSSRPITEKELLQVYRLISLRYWSLRQDIQTQKESF